VMANVKTIVCGIYALPRLSPKLNPNILCSLRIGYLHIGIFKNIMPLEPFKQPIDHLVKGLQGSQALSIKVVIIIHIGLVLPGQILDPARSR